MRAQILIGFSFAYERLLKRICGECALSLQACNVLWCAKCGGNVLRCAKMCGVQGTGKGDWAYMNFLLCVAQKYFFNILYFYIDITLSKCYNLECPNERIQERT